MVVVTFLHKNVHSLQYLSHKLRMHDSRISYKNQLTKSRPSPPYPSSPSVPPAKGLHIQTLTGPNVAWL
jgi:hypothetical protein